jgi:drug/metabolite transporter (DMT)-like permease
MRDEARAFCLALAAVLIWSTVASAFKITLRHAEAASMLFWASLTSACVLLALVLARDGGRRLRSLTARDLAASLGMGFLNPFAYYLILFKAYDLLPAQEAQPLNYTWAITLSLLSVPLLGHRLRPADLLALFVSYTGVYVICTRGQILEARLSDPLGAGLALGSTVVWALYWILNARDPQDPAVRLFLNFLFGTLLTGGFLLVAERGPAPLPLPGMLGSVYIGIFEMGVTFVLWSTALKLTSSAARVSILIYLSPFVSLIFIRFLVGEIILTSTFAGLFLIVAGIGLQHRARLRRA